jgi:hypothetical protein
MGTEHTEERPAPLRGYRVLSDEEKAMVDRIKLAEEQLGLLWAEVFTRPETDKRMANIAKTGLQDAFMWWVRSITQPLDAYAEALARFEEADRG